LSFGAIMIVQRAALQGRLKDSFLRRADAQQLAFQTVKSSPALCWMAAVAALQLAAAPRACSRPQARPGRIIRSHPAGLKLPGLARHLTAAQIPPGRARLPSPPGDLPGAREVRYCCRPQRQHARCQTLTRLPRAAYAAGSPTNQASGSD
jgi:hypothetical protein